MLEESIPQLTSYSVAELSWRCGSRVQMSLSSNPGPQWETSLRYISNLWTTVGHRFPDFLDLRGMASLVGSQVISGLCSERDFHLSAHSPC